MSYTEAISILKYPTHGQYVPLSFWREQSVGRLSKQRAVDVQPALNHHVHDASRRRVKVPCLGAVPTGERWLPCRLHPSPTGNPPKF